MFDKITIEELQIHGYHGVLEEEKRLGQKFLVSLVLYGEFINANNDDNIDDTIDYGKVCHYVENIFNQKKFNLIESVADYICTQILLQYDKIDKVEVDIKKPWAPIGLPFKNVWVSKSRSWHTVYLGLGSNMDNRDTYLDLAVSELKKDELCKNVEESTRIQTKPYGYLEQEDFMNSCVRVQTIRNPKELLHFINSIETKANRERKIHWGPRTLDVDILLFDHMVYQSDNLNIPHIDMTNREFVLEPLTELAPNYIHPVLQKSIKQIYAKLKESKE